MFQDFRYGARMLFKSKGFTIVAVLSLALGIGANTALFSVVDAVLLKTLPVKEPDRLVLFEWQSGRPFRTNGMRGTFVSGPPNTRGGSVFRYDIFQKLKEAREQAPDGPLTDFFAFGPIYELTAVLNEQAEIITGQVVTGGYYSGLGVRPILGRAIDESDDSVSAPPVVVLSYKYWQERFGGGPAAIGGGLKLNQTLFTIIGVTPPAFTIGAPLKMLRPVLPPRVKEPGIPPGYRIARACSLRLITVADSATQTQIADDGFAALRCCNDVIGFE